MAKLVLDLKSLQESGSVTLANAAGITEIEWQLFCETKCAVDE